MSHRYTLHQLADIVDGRIRGHSDVTLTGIADVGEAGSEDVTWVSGEKYVRKLKTSHAGAVLVESDFGDTRMPAILCDHLELSVAKLLGAFLENISKPEPGVHPTACIHPSATIGDKPSIGPHVTIDADVTIGSSCVIHAGTFIGQSSTVGDECLLWPNVVIRDGCILGDRVIIQSNSVIGSDGFGYYFDEGRHNKYPHAGGVMIGDDVEIGSCACVDRAKFGFTRIGRGSKIDNHVHIAHNVHIGEHCVFAGHTGISGSVRIGDYCLFGGRAAVLDNLNIGNQVKLAGGLTVATKDIPDGVMISGLHGREHRQDMREQVSLKKLPAIVEQLRELTERVKQLEASKHHQP